MYNDNVDRDPDSCIGSHAKLWLYYIISSILFSRNKQTSQPTCNMKTLLLTSFVSGQAAFGIQFLCQQWEQFSSLRNNGIKIQLCLKSLSSSSSSSSTSTLPAGGPGFVAPGGGQRSCLGHQGGVEGGTGPDHVAGPQGSGIHGKSHWFSLRVWDQHLHRLHLQMWPLDTFGFPRFSDLLKFLDTPDARIKDSGKANTRVLFGLPLANQRGQWLPTWNSKSG